MYSLDCSQSVSPCAAKQVQASQDLQSWHRSRLVIIVLLGDGVWLEMHQVKPPQGSTVIENECFPLGGPIA